MTESTVAESSFIDFHWDDKWHWVVHESGYFRVCDPDYWAELLGVTKMEDGCYYLASEVCDKYYGIMRVAVELHWNDNRVVKVNLTAPDGDLLKEDIKRFYTHRRLPS